jgi:multiple sugar transport system substrate-binding protein
VGAAVATTLVMLVLVSLATAGSTPVKLTVWADNIRAPYVQTYEKTHPDIDIDLQVVDQSQVLTKLQLASTGGGTLPDLTWSGDPSLYAGIKQIFSADISSHIPRSILNRFAKGSLAVCQEGRKLLCLRNDLAQQVLWYDADRMREYGYAVPRTWQQFKALGLRAAREHPGTIVGMFGGDLSPEIWFSQFGCPVTDLVGPKTVRINLAAPACKRMLSVVDPLLKAGALAKIGEFDPAAPQLFQDDKNVLLMQVGPSWWGTGTLKGYYKLPAGRWSATMPPRWGNEPVVTGFLGGGNWFVSKESANIKEAASVAQWLVTSPVLQREGYPAYVPAAVVYGKNFARDPFFASNPFPALKDAASKITNTWDYVSYSHKNSFLETIAKAVQDGQTVASAMPAYEAGLIRAARSAGYTVVR